MERMPVFQPGRRRHHHCRCFGVLLFLLSLLTPPAAITAPAAESPAFEPAVMQAELGTAEEAFRHGGLGVREMESLAATLTRLQSAGNNCLEITGKHLEDAQRFSAAIGEALPNEPAHLTAARDRVHGEQRQLEARQAECRLLALRAEELAGRFGKELQRLRAHDLRTRGDSLPKAMLRLVREGVSRERLALLLDELRSSLLSWRTPAIAGIALGAGLAGWFVGAPLGRLLGKTPPGGLAFVLSGLAAVLSSAFGGWALFDNLLTPLSLSTRLLASAVLLVTLGMALALLKRRQAALALGQLFLLLWGVPLAIMLCLVFSPPDILHVSPPLQLVRGLAVTVFCLVSLRLERGLFPGQAGPWHRLGRGGLTVLLMAVPLAEWLGYRDLSTFMLMALGGSLTLAGAVFFCDRTIPPSISGLAHGITPWQQRLRRALGLEDGVVVSGLIWLGRLVRLLLWFFCLLGVLWFWDAGGKWSRAVLELYQQGFALGNVTVKPSRVVQGLLVFCLGWSLLALVRRQADRWSFGLESELEPGVRETLGSITGYVGYALVIVLSLLVGGLDFTGLAVVAGALSVGLGFGLKNILENFVSGLILLFERPIKRGDWIQVGGTEGYVKRISVRSTVIQTFENADVIVPNSELIANQVTNLMFDDDRRGRLRIPVGVAYGSDTDLVERLLVDVTRQHPQILVGSSLPDPWVVFLRFGESSLDFELSCYLREIDARVRVRSDLLHAIDRAFREHGIEIPFPQRDVHIRQAHAMVLSPAEDSHKK